ncbi:MAG: hypothetical protein AAFQ68_28215, partial [Bacteroidota bacterium]
MKAYPYAYGATMPRSEQILFEIDGFTAELCRAADSLQTAYRLRYQAYLESEAVDPNPDGKLKDTFDLQPNTFTHLIWYDGLPVGTVRSHLHCEAFDWRPTECSNYFPVVVERELGAKTQYLESNRYAISPDLGRRQSLFAQSLIFRIHALCSAIYGCSHILTIVREKHLPFYQRFLAFDLLTEERCWYEPMQSQI